MKSSYLSENRQTDNSFDANSKAAIISNDIHNVLEQNSYEDEYSENFDENEEEDSYYEDDVELIPDVDMKHIDNGIYVAYYAEKILMNAKNEEPKTISTSKFLMTQDQISQETRKTGVKWIMELSDCFHLTHDCFFFAVETFDILLCNKRIELSSLRYYLAACVWIANKMDIGRYCNMNIFSKEEDKNKMIKAETDIARIFNFNFGYPTVKLFLSRLLVVLDTDKLLMEVSNFFCEASTLIAELLDYSPRVVATASCILAQLSIGRQSNMTKLMIFSHISDIQELKQCANILLVKIITFVENDEEILCDRYKREGMDIRLEKLKLNMNILDEI